MLVRRGARIVGSAVAAQPRVPGADDRLPYYTGDSNTVMAAKVATHQGAETAVIWLTFGCAWGLTAVAFAVAAVAFACRSAGRP